MTQHTTNSLLIAVAIANVGVLLAVIVTILGYPLLGTLCGLLLSTSGIVLIIKDVVLPLALELEQWRISYSRVQGDAL